MCVLVIDAQLVQLVVSMFAFRFQSWEFNSCLCLVYFLCLVCISLSVQKCIVGLISVCVCAQTSKGFTFFLFLRHVDQNLVFSLGVKC